MDRANGGPLHGEPGGDRRPRLPRQGGDAGLHRPSHHLVFAGSREEEFAMRSAGLSYGEIAERGGGILSTVQKVRDTPKKDLKKSARRWINAMLQHGTTSVEIKSGYGLDTDSEIKLLETIRELDKEEVMTVVSTFLGAHATPPEFRENKAGHIDLIGNHMLPYF